MATAENVGKNLQKKDAAGLAMSGLQAYAASGGGRFTSCAFSNDYLDNFPTSVLLYIHGKPTGASTFIVFDGDTNTFTTSHYS